MQGNVLPEMPPRIKARLFAIFDIAIHWNKADRQVTVRAEITESTLRAVQDILNPTETASPTPTPASPNS